MTETGPSGAENPRGPELRFEVPGETVAAWSPPRDPSAGALAIAVRPPGGDEVVRPGPGAIDAALRYGIDLSDLAERYRVTGRAGEVTVIELPRLHERSRRSLPWDGLPATVVFLGVGDLTGDCLRSAGEALWPVIRSHEVTGVDLGASLTSQAVDAFVTGVMSASYVRPRYGKKPDDDGLVLEAVIQFLGASQSAGELSATARFAAQLGRAAQMARELTDVPSNIKSPSWLAARCVELAEREGMSASVYDEAWLRSQGFGGLLAVGRGAETPPCFVTLTYEPDATAGGLSFGAELPHYVIVGKGITFDTGGLAIKPREPMALMKTDMAGAAAAIGAIAAIARLNVSLRVTVVLPIAENSFSGAAYRAGDIVTMADGTTVEITNTDAEGRLALADAIAWARTTLSPDAIIDVATLTGAARLALGTRTAAFYSTSDALAELCSDSAASGGENVWRLPLPAAYRSAIDSRIADLRQTAIEGQHAGSIMAALFLERFAGEADWLHLDIAGTARGSSPRQGATGFGVQTLARLLVAAADR
ncbi:hypothetical protein GCM10010401_18380 [Rarobacter faecitabidus]|uniref:Probable cytosol aminopeptidase n=1 Tax=Rarobacter faecitabidus TaxID=13243 RepID=A0A542ZUL3_RARFA|nr:leucyl aminopeptidase family protein [Rarobacter faecitabidus]TQL64048.1 leucyl aminopeptidase [Rarobacter faecitabidus]